MKRRSRDTVLQAAITFRSARPGLSLTDLIAFLYIAENPGISFAELAHVSAINKMTVSRIVRRLSGEDAEAAGSREGERSLVRVEPNAADDRSLVVFLTPAGRALCAKVDEAISHAILISPPQDGN
jgi:DNA-binding MarR family transcriptional regulator